MGKNNNSVLNESSIKFNWYYLSIIILVVYIFLSLILGWFPFNINPSDKTTIMNILKNYFQIIFFIVTAILAILSYRQARQTLFNPIRTEIFKIQIQEYTSIIEFFRKETFNDVFDYKRIVLINATNLIDTYASTFFEDEMDKARMDKKREEDFKDIKGSLISRDYLESDNFELIGYENKPVKKEVKITNPALILKKWEEYKFSIIDFTIKYDDSNKHIRDISSSPLLPKILVALIKTFQNKEAENLNILGQLLTEKAKDFPSKYPNLESLKEINLIGFWSDFNHKKNDLVNEANNILEFINSYLKIDHII